MKLLNKGRGLLVVVTKYSNFDFSKKQLTHSFVLHLYNRFPMIYLFQKLKVGLFAYFQNSYIKTFVTFYHIEYKQVHTNVSFFLDSDNDFLFYVRKYSFLVEIIIWLSRMENYFRRDLYLLSNLFSTFFEFVKHFSL